MADFMGCKRMTERLVRWLHEAAEEVVRGSADTLPTEEPPLTQMQLCPLVWHLTEVCPAFIVSCVALMLTYRGGLQQLQQL